MVYQNEKLMDAFQKALEENLQEGERVIRRDAFRWKDQNGDVLSNHYECHDLVHLADDFNYEVMADFHHIGIIKDKD